MTGGNSDTQHQESPYENYDRVLSQTQKEILDRRLKLGHNGILLETIEGFCKDYDCKKEEFLDLACKLYDVTRRSVSKDARHLGTLHYLPGLEKKFGRKEGYFAFEHIILPLQSYILNAHSPYNAKNDIAVKEELIENFSEEHKEN